MIYLDHHAATPLCEAAAQAMQEAREQAWANPSSVHAAGRKAKAVLERARGQVAGALGAAPADVVLTGGGTEACNLGVQGAWSGQGEVLTTAIEHPAVAEAVARLGRQGAHVKTLQVPAGRPPSADELEAALTPRTRLVALQWVNHETGTVLPVPEYAERCHRAGVPLFVDATQALGKLPVDVTTLGATAVAVASHKIGGPAGAAALWVDRRQALEPVLAGGGQERGRRPGSPDPIAQAGFGAACAHVQARRDAVQGLASVRARLESALEHLGASVNAASGKRVATVSNVSFRKQRGDMLVAALDVEGVCVSSGAACSSGLSEPSAVLSAMYPQEAWRARGALRFSMGPETEAADVEAALDALRRVLSRTTSQAISA